MPTARQLLSVCIASSVVAVVVVLVMHAIGMGDNATIAAAVSGSMAASLTATYSEPEGKTGADDAQARESEA